MDKFIIGDLVSFTVDGVVYIGYIIDKEQIGFNWLINIGGHDNWSIFEDDITLESRSELNITQ